MAANRVLADGRIKFTVLTTAPANPAAPTATELNATGALDLSKKVLSDNFLWGATDSDKVAEKALADINNANALSAANFQIGFTIWRYFAQAGGFDATEDAVFQAFKTRGLTFYGYARKMDKLASAAWASTDEIFLGAIFTTDTPQPVDGGYIKYRVPGECQSGYPFITVGT